MRVVFSTGEAINSRPLKLWQEVLAGLFSIALGILVLYFSISSIKTYNEKNEVYVETTSKVVDYKYDNDGLKAIVVEYVVDGQTYRIVSGSYTNMPKSIGTEVSIKYDPNNPQDAIWTLDSANIILPILGIVFTLAGIVVVISSIKKGKSHKKIENQVVEKRSELYNDTDVKSQDVQSTNNYNQTINQQNSDADINNQNNI